MFLVRRSRPREKCEMKQTSESDNSNRNGKGGVISMPNAASGMQTKNGRLQNEAVLYPCAADTMQDSRVMWATLTPRGTTRHYLEEHTYETIGGGQFHKRACATTPTEHVKLKAI